MNAPEIRPIEWRGNAEAGALALLDQRALPDREVWVECRSVAEAAQAIRDMTVRGAPAIGLVAAYAMVLAAQEAARRRPEARREHLAASRRLLAATRPTAINLRWALEHSGGDQVDPSPEARLARARELHRMDLSANREIAALGAQRIEPGMGVLTHCNAGALATGGVGTALGAIVLASWQGKGIHVFVDETRPRLQGARLTCWELRRLGVPHTLICEGMAASLMAAGQVQLCLTGADRIARNGDTANKVGTYSVAVNAHHHRIPFHVAAPASTFDLASSSGVAIPIEERTPDEVTRWADGWTCPEGTPAYNPAFDVTPAALIRSIITDRGEIAPVNATEIARVLGPRLIAIKEPLEAQR